MDIFFILLLLVWFPQWQTSSISPCTVLFLLIEYLQLAYKKKAMNHLEENNQEKELVFPL